MLYEQFWNCPACGTQGISALRQMRCPNCTEPKPAQTETYHTGAEITDPVGIALARGAPHWVCDHCWVKNLGDAKVCASCANPRTAEDDTFIVRELGTTLPVRPPDSDQSTSPSVYHASTNPSYHPSGQVLWQATNSNDDAAAPMMHVGGRAITRQQGYVGIGILVVILMAIVGWAIFHTSTVEARVTGFTWSREVVIEQYQTIHDSGWSAPVDAFNVSTSQRISGYNPIYETQTEQVTHNQTCYRDLGTGATESYDCSYTSTESRQVKVGEVPIYDTWYEYDVDRWVHARSIPVSGADRNPFWPEYELQFAGQTVIGAERVSDTPQSYTVHFVQLNADEPQTYSLSVPESEWHQYDVEAKYQLEVNAFDGIRNNPLTGNE